MQEKRVSLVFLNIFPKMGVGDFAVIIGRQTESIPHSVSHY